MASAFQILGGYSLLLMVLGSIMSLATFYICYRLRKNTTLVFLLFMSLSDLVSLYYWNLQIFLQAFTTINLAEVDRVICKLLNYVTISSLEISAWLLVSYQFTR